MERNYLLLLKKQNWGHIPLRGTTTDDYFTNSDYILENVTTETPIQTIKMEIVNRIMEIRGKIDTVFVEKDSAIQKRLMNANNRFIKVTDLIKDGLDKLGCKDIYLDKSKYKEITKENRKTATSFSFEVPLSELFMDMTLYMNVGDYDLERGEIPIYGYINFSELWIQDPNSIVDLEQSKSRLKRTDLIITGREDIENGVSMIIDRVSTLDKLARKNIDLYYEMGSGSFSVKAPEILELSSVLSQVPDLFVSALQKSSVSELDRGEKAYYNNFVKIKNEYDRGNYDSLEELYDLFKFDYDEVIRKVRSLHNKKGTSSQYNALFDLYFHKLGEVWEEIARRFNNKTLFSLHTL